MLVRLNPITAALVIARYRLASPMHRFSTYMPPIAPARSPRRARRARSRKT